MVQTYDILGAARRTNSLSMLTFGALQQKPAAAAIFRVLSSVGSERRLDRAEVGSSSLPAPTIRFRLQKGSPVAFDESGPSLLGSLRSGERQMDASLAVVQLQPVRPGCKQSNDF
jgi:hypothetical protein